MINPFLQENVYIPQTVTRTTIVFSENLGQRFARLSLHNGSTAVRTTANRNTAIAKENATMRTRRCSNFPAALAKKRTVANKTVFPRY
jgi:hypothetical protein